MNLSTVSTRPIQSEFCLPPRLTLDETDRIRELLREAVALLNDEQCPAARVELFADVRELREKLAILEGRK